MKTARVSDFAVQAETRLEPLIYANDQLVLERAALDELETFAQIEGIQQLAFTPDFHKGSGTPIGTVALCDRVYPRVPGNDIGCGMRLDVLSLKQLVITDDLMNHLRHAFFEGGREVFVENRDELLASGLEAAIHGRSANRIGEDVRAHASGALGQGEVSPVLDPYRKLASKRDNFLGSVGGGNHFVELQQVDEIVDAHAAYVVGLTKDAFCVMVHSGSLDNGHQVAQHFTDLAKSRWTGRHPQSGYFPLQDGDARDYIVASNNASNFAMVNRAVMAGMVADVLGCYLKMIYDAPHNLITEHGQGFLHRKGACPAGTGELVLVPGSMGSRSFVGIGTGFSGTLGSAPHGAGRVMSRNASRAAVGDLDGIKLVSKVDPRQVRPDVASEVMKNLLEEAPRSYKDLTQVVATCVAADMVRPVAWLKPLATIKG